jgi:hypothetical protein
MTERDNVAERRDRGDRREGQQGQGRRGGKKRSSGLLYILRAVGLVAVLVAVIVYTVANTRPIYSISGTLGDELRKHAPGMAGVIAPNDSTHVDQLMATAKFQAEKRNFFMDVMRLKQVDSARADSIAQFAVREAYVRGISPAIIFGVMLTENARFISKATSNVGAVGLMQIYPKVWLTKEMSALFGKDIATDSTNVKYGVFILSQYFRPRTKSGQTTDRDWQTALLRYNGCVKGTNTPRCHTYPDKVQRFVEGSAKSICDGRSFYECIGKPFIAGLFGKTNGTQQPTTTTAVSAASVATPAAAPIPATAAPSPQPPAPVTSRPVSAPTVTPHTAGAARAGTSAHVRAAKPTSRKTSARKPSAKRAPAKASAKKKAAQPKGRTPTSKPKAPLKLPRPINVIIPTP